MRLGLVSAKGSPGVTTLALSVAAVTGGVMIEADPAGGDVECWVGPSGESGLIGLAGGLRRAMDPDGLLVDHAVEVVSGVRVVLAPVGGDQAESTLVSIGGRLEAALRAETGWVVVDGGRWSPRDATAFRLSGCDAVAVVVSPTRPAAAHAGTLIAGWRAMLNVPIAAVVIGERGYPPDEIAASIGAPVAGPVAWDRRAVETLLVSGASRAWSRSKLERDGRSVAERLTELAVEGATARG